LSDLIPNPIAPLPFSLANRIIFIRIAKWASDSRGGLMTIQLCKKAEVDLKLELPMKNNFALISLSTLFSLNCFAGGGSPQCNSSPMTASQASQIAAAKISQFEHAGYTQFYGSNELSYCGDSFVYGLKNSSGRVVLLAVGWDVNTSGYGVVASETYASCQFDGGNASNMGGSSVLKAACLK
jgi:hypothetical protein